VQLMKYAASLQPTTTESLKFQSGRCVAIPKATPTFPRWHGDPVGKTYGGKAVLDINGRPAFAESLILWTLQKAGWDGVWVDRKVFRTGYWNCVPQKSLPKKPSSVSEEIRNLAKTPPGVWGVFCWQDDRFLFAESKKSGRDKIRPDQVLFAESALNIGLPLDSLLLVEWKEE
jgi:hypothetical protein